MVVGGAVGYHTYMFAHTSSLARIYELFSSFFRAPHTHMHFEEACARVAHKGYSLAPDVRVVSKIGSLFLFMCVCVCVYACSLTEHTILEWW